MLKVLENHHAATTIKILTTEGYNILENMKSQDFVKFRKYLIFNILQTDIT